MASNTSINTRTNSAIETDLLADYVDYAGAGSKDKTFTIELTYLEWQDLIFGTWSERDIYQLGDEEIKRRNCQRICQAFKQPDDYTLFDKIVKAANDDDFFVDTIEAAKNVFKSAKGDLKKSKHTGLYYPPVKGGLTDVYPAQPVKHQSHDPLAFDYKSKDDKIANTENLRRENSTFKYSFAHAKEYAKCSVNVEYWAETYGVLADNQRFIHPVLFDYQRKLLKTMTENRKTIACLSRRTGKTATSGLLMAHNAIFKRRTDIGIISMSTNTAKEAMKTCYISVTNQPDFMSPCFVNDNSTEMVLDNHVRVKTFSSDPHSSRGYTLGFCMIDEAAYMGRWDELYSTVSPIVNASSENKLIICSTPVGRNHFHALWKAAKDNKNGFATCFAVYYENPRNLYNRDTGVFDDGASLESEERASSNRFDSEYLCTFDSNDDATLVAKHHLDWQDAARVEYIKNHQLAPKKHRRIKNTMIFADRIKNHEYVITSDTAQGRGRDYSAVLVWDTTNPDFAVQVATMYDNTTKPDKLAKRIKALSEYYDDAGVFVELASSGTLIVDKLKSLDTPLIKDEKHGVYGFPVKTPSVKTDACQLLDGLMSNREILILDKRVTDELRNFVEVATSKAERMTFEARTGFHDDMAMSCVAYSWLNQYGFLVRKAKHDDSNLHHKRNGVDDPVELGMTHEDGFGWVSTDGRQVGYQHPTGGLFGVAASMSMKAKGLLQTYGSVGSNGVGR